MMLSSHLCLCLPLGLVVKGFHLNIFLATLDIMISNFRRVLKVICFFLDKFPATEFYMPTFRNILSVPSS